MKLQQHDNDDGWVEFVGVARLVALMMRTIEECQEEDMRNIFDNIMVCGCGHVGVVIIIIILES